MAHRAFLFTQIAWGRLLLQTLPLTFSPDYFFLDAHGNIIESGRVAEEPNFCAAAQAGEQSGGTPGFKRLALTSADVKVVNDMFNNGKGKEGAHLGSPMLFTEPPTEAGMAKAQQLLREHSATFPKTKSPSEEGGSGKPAPPKWQFWKRGST